MIVYNKRQGMITLHCAAVHSNQLWNNVKYICVASNNVRANYPHMTTKCRFKPKTHIEEALTLRALTQEQLRYSH